MARRGGAGDDDDDGGDNSGDDGNGDRDHGRVSSPATFVSGSSVLIALSSAGGADDSMPHSPATATAASPPPLVPSASVDGAWARPAPPAAPVWEYPHAAGRPRAVSAAASVGGAQRAPNPAVASLSSHQHGGKAPSGKARRSSTAKAGSRKTRRSRGGALAEQWALVAPMLAGQPLYLLSEQHQPAGRAPTSEARRGAARPQATVVLTLSADYTRLVLRRSGSHVSSFLRVADLTEVARAGTRRLAVSAASMRASAEEVRAGRRGAEADVVLELPALSIALRSRSLLLAARDDAGAQCWLDGLDLLMAHRERLHRLKTDFAAFQYPALFSSNARARQG